MNNKQGPTQLNKMKTLFWYTMFPNSPLFTCLLLSDNVATNTILLTTTVTIWTCMYNTDSTSINYNIICINHLSHSSHWYVLFSISFWEDPLLHVHSPEGGTVVTFSSRGIARGHSREHNK